MARKSIEQLRDIGKKISELGFVIGEGGNISVREKNLIFIKRKGASMEEAATTDYIPVSFKTGRPLRKGDEPSTEIYMHLACYRARDDINAVIHTHPIFATALGMVKRKPAVFTYEAAVNIRSSVAYIGYLRPGTSRLGQAVGRAARKHNALLLKNHGLVTVGRNVREAYLRTLAVERAAIVYLVQRLLQ